MKINGRTFSQPNTNVVVIPRTDGEVVFKIKSVLSDDPFYALCPLPKAPLVTLPGGAKARNVEDTEYKEECDQWIKKKTDWMFVESLRETEGLEWETVKYDEPLTWQNWTKDLKDAFFTDTEIAHLTNEIVRVNNLNQAVLDEARDRFLARQAQPEK